jgi:hypothetical protein
MNAYAPEIEPNAPFKRNRPRASRGKVSPRTGCLVLVCILLHYRAVKQRSMSSHLHFSIGLPLRRTRVLSRPHNWPRYLDGHFEGASQKKGRLAMFLPQKNQYGSRFRPSGMRTGKTRALDKHTHVANSSVLLACFWVPDRIKEVTAIWPKRCVGGIHSNTPHLL